jgi:flavin reductase (DIM6/NTAB) family NADH-FMN oxidoreductase RutF
MFYDTRDGSRTLPHDPFKAIVAPRPIGWISSISAKGEVNLAPTPSSMASTASRTW